MRRNKYNAVKVKCEHCGFTHDSKMEAAYCTLLHLEARTQGTDIVHIDVFPVVTLGKNIKWKLDFCVWRAGPLAPYIQYCEFIDVKGQVTQDFKLKRKLFENNHPATLKVVTRKGKKWVEM